MTIETEARLDLIHMSILILGGLDDALEHHEIYGLIEALCRHRDKDVQTCLSEPRREILIREDPEAFSKWAADHPDCQTV